MIKAIKIDVQNRTVTEVEIQNNLEAYYKEIGCDLVEFVKVDEVNDLMVDEEGLFTKNPFFIMEGLYQPMRGNGLIVGVDFEEGETISTTLTVDEVKARVHFV